MGPKNDNRRCIGLYPRLSSNIGSNKSKLIEFGGIMEDSGDNAAILTTDHIYDVGGIGEDDTQHAEGDTDRWIHRDGKLSTIP